MLEQLKELIEKATKRDEESALEIMELLSIENKDILETDEKYWVSEWSWHPISDGIYSYEENLRSVQVTGNVVAYYTDMNYRVFFPWDIYETKEECDQVCELKNSFGYDWDMAHNKFIKRYNLQVTMK